MNIKQKIFLPLITLLAIEELTVIIDVVVTEKETEHMSLMFLT